VLVKPLSSPELARSLAAALGGVASGGAPSVLERVRPAADAGRPRA
jgi:hypothetical protein